MAPINVLALPSGKPTRVHSKTVQNPNCESFFSSVLAQATPNLTQAHYLTRVACPFDQLLNFPLLYCVR